ncbi:hypothetical protein ACOMHN_060833 [Nucella lapillus]
MELHWMVYVALAVAMMPSLTNGTVGTAPEPPKENQPEDDKSDGEQLNLNQNAYVEPEVVFGINKLINAMLYGGYSYLCMHAFYGRKDIALPGFAKFFKNLSDKRFQAAVELIQFQNLRGGHVVLTHIPIPLQTKWAFARDAMLYSLGMEKNIQRTFLAVDEVAGDKNDIFSINKIEGDFLLEELPLIKQIADYVTQLTRAGPGLGEFMFDKYLYKPEYGH